MDPQEIIDPQPAPQYRPGALSMHALASKLHEMRGEHGWEKYSSRLQTHNGRDAQIDMIQESLDRLVYELQAYLEKRALAGAHHEFRMWLMSEGVASQLLHPGDVLDRYTALTNPEALAQRVDALAAELAGGPDVEA